MNPSTALASVVVDELARAGLTHAVLAPGSRSAALAVALDNHERIRLHVSIDERSAAFLALGIARSLRAPAAVVCTSGTAAANFHPAVIEADLGRVPLLLLTADRPEELRATGANQTIDQIKLYGNAVRFFCDVSAPFDPSRAAPYWRSLVSQAHAVAAGPPPGPVHMNLAFREPLLETESAERFRPEPGLRPPGRPWTDSIAAPRAASPEIVDDLVDRMSGVERGLVVAGDGDLDHAAVVELAERARWPLLAEPASGARRGPNAISTFDALLRHGPFARGHHPELVVRFGVPNLSRALSRFLSPDVDQIHVDRDGVGRDPERAVSRVIVADEAALCRAAAERLERSPSSPWLEDWQLCDRAAREAIDGLLDQDDTPTEPRVCRDLARLAPDSAVLIAASSMPVRDLNSFMSPRTGLRVLGNRGASGIDGFVSMSLGAALAHPGPAVAVAGDLSLIHDQNGLIGSSQVDLGLVVLNNDGGGIFSMLPQASVRGFERLFGTPHGLDLAVLAELYGLAYARLERASELAEALDGGGLRLIEARTDRDENALLHRRLWAAVASALESRRASPPAPTASPEA